MSKRLSLQPLELVLLVVLTMGVTTAALSALRQPNAVPLSEEVKWLLETYGPAKESQYVEEWIIRDFFGDKRDGVFVDIGAADYRQFSNTYFLEIERGWSGIGVDAQESFGADYAAHRPRTRFVNFFVSNVSDAKATLYVNQLKWVASEQQSFTARWSDQTTAMEIPTITMNDLLSAHKIERFDFLSLDIELAEPKALEGFDIERFRPSLVCVEAHPEVRQQLLDYFHAHGYVVIGKYLRMDDKNLYFMPAGHDVKPLPADIMATWTEH